jgi:hypothetical protein
MGIKNTETVRKEFRRFNRYLVFKRFMKYVKIGNPDECWEWQGCSHDGIGYGAFRWPEKHIQLASQAAYELFVGHIPTVKKHGKRKYEVCHNCPEGDNPKCVNPYHLWLGTHKQNMEDAVGKGKDKFISSAKLDIEKADKIRKKYAKGNITYEELAEDYNVSYKTIQNVMRNVLWVQ